MPNPRTKGASGEREICNTLNTILYTLYTELNLTYPFEGIVQRNQMQSAVGGRDLVGTFNFCIEVKRQEVLQIERWWNQAVDQARRVKDGIPVLIYRQNRERWTVMLPMLLQISTGSFIRTRGTMTLLDFEKYFKAYCKQRLIEGHLPNGD